MRQLVPYRPSVFSAVIFHFLLISSLLTCRVVCLHHRRPRPRPQHLGPTSSLLLSLHSRKTEQPVDRIFFFQPGNKLDGGNRKRNPFEQDLNIFIMHHCLPLRVTGYSKHTSKQIKQVQTLLIKLPRRANSLPRRRKTDIVN